MLNKFTVSITEFQLNQSIIYRNSLERALHPQTKSESTYMGYKLRMIVERIKFLILIVSEF